MKKVVLASGNQGKLREFSQLLSGLEFNVVAQSEYFSEQADEVGLSFVENAILKARFACERTGLPAIADDSGIEVDALNGRPGIHSARYSGEGATDARNNAKLLDDLQSVPADARTARYHAVLVYMRHQEDPTPIICHGVWEGRVLTEPRGEGGFGYDPLFFISTHNCAAAELSKEEKNAISHRGKAMRELVARLMAEQSTRDAS
jgi:XTP/dITP diphosphohydrolase